MSQQTPTIVFLFLHGPEVRQYMHSGVIPHLLCAGARVAVLARHVDSDLIAQLPGVSEIIELPRLPVSLLFSQLRYALDAANSHREKLEGYLEWKYLPKGERINWKGRMVLFFRDVLSKLLTQSPKLYCWATKLEQIYLKRTSYPEWESLITRLQPILIVTSIPKTVNIETALATATRRNIRTVLFYSTLKDITAPTGRCNHSFDAIGVWNQWMLERFTHQNPHVDPRKVHVVGCTHFDTVSSHAPTLSKTELYTLLSLKPDARILLFTAANPQVVAHEERYIKLLVDWIDLGILPSDTYIVIRANPMDQDRILQAAVKDYSHVVVTTPNWRWQPELNWCFQRKNDQEVYNALLHFAMVNVSIPSTVTVECAVAGLPVINIGFDLPGVSTHHEKILDFWNADFYKLVRETGAAVLAESPETLLSILNQALAKRALFSEGQQSFLENYLGTSPGNAAHSYIELIRTIVKSE